MYGATLSGLAELFSFYAALFVSFSLCLAAIAMALAGRFRDGAKGLAVGSMICSGIGGILFLSLLSSRIFSDGCVCAV